MLAAALPVLQTEIQLALIDALQKGVLKLFPHSLGGDDSIVAQELALKFATEVSNNLAPKLASSINNFVMQADITGSPLGLVTVAGPVTGAVAPKSLVLI